MNPVGTMVSASTFPPGVVRKRAGQHGALLTGFLIGYWGSDCSDFLKLLWNPLPPQHRDIHCMTEGNTIKYFKTIMFILKTPI